METPVTNLNTNTGTLTTTSLPSGKALVSSKGNVTGRRYFMGTMPAADLKEHFKGQGLTGKALKLAVNKALTEETTQRKVMAAVAVEAAISHHGMIPDRFDVRKNTATLVFTKLPDTDTTSKTKKLEAEKEKLESEKEKLAREVAELRAQLDSKVTPEPVTIEA
jgi:hypothetical protein